MEQFWHLTITGRIRSRLNFRIPVFSLQTIWSPLLRERFHPVTTPRLSRGLTALPALLWLKFTRFRTSNAGVGAQRKAPSYPGSVLSFRTACCRTYLFINRHPSRSIIAEP